MNDTVEDKLAGIKQDRLLSKTPLSVREAIAQLATMEDMDAEFCFNFHNSDPIPIVSIEDDGDGRVVCASV